MNKNRYHFTGKNTKICWSCGFIMANNKSHHGKACRLPNPTGRNDLSPCEIAKNSYTAKMARLKYKAEGKKYNTDMSKKSLTLQLDVAKRLCLRCDKPFKSRSRGNRICERCGRINEGHDTEGLGRIGVGMKLDYSWND